MAEYSTFSNLLFIDECLLDRERTEALRAAIRRKVRPGDTVLDAGTGSGILALFAAEAGARKVYAVDANREAVAVARAVVRANPAAGDVEVLHADLLEFRADWT